MAQDGAFYRERMRNFMRKEKLRRNNFISAAVRITLIVLSAILIVLPLSGCKDTSDNFLTVDGEGIKEDEFKFFCSLVLEDEAFVYDAYNDLSKNFTEAVMTEALSFAKEYIIRSHEAVKKGFTLTEEEKADILEDAEAEYSSYKELYDNSITEEDFYTLFYGISKEKYIYFRENWLIIDKYNNRQYEDADIGEESQKETFEKYKDYLATKSLSVIVIDISDKSGESLENAYMFADLIYNKAKNGSDFDQLMKDYSDDEELTNAGGKINVGASFATVHPEIYEWSKNAAPGDLGKAEEDTAIYILKCNSEKTFEELKDTENMIEWTRFRITQESIDELMHSSKYKVTLNEEAYKTCDISSLINDAIDYWTSLWNTYGFPATGS